MATDLEHLQHGSNLVLADRIEVRDLALERTLSLRVRRSDLLVNGELNPSAHLYDPLRFGGYAREYQARLITPLTGGSRRVGDEAQINPFAAIIRERGSLRVDPPRIWRAQCQRDQEHDASHEDRPHDRSSHRSLLSRLANETKERR